jgi:hypothetical protein
MSLDDWLVWASVAWLLALALTAGTIFVIFY